MSRKNHLSNQKITALYCRISLDDGSQNESMSISNQKLLLKDYAEKNGMPRYEYYVDDGYTGRNFNRPSFQRLIADIEAGKVGCVITKDLSRLGRNYIEAGSYIEIFFPKHNVRYIAVTDGVDSLTRQEMDITPFENILNDIILRNPFYKGAHLVCRTHQKGIRSNTYDIIPREEWEVLEGCHEAIVSPEDWEKVQELIDRRPPIMEGNACPFYNLFHGIIYCATCGKSMQVRYEKVGRTGKNRFTGEEREPIDKAYYICQTYNRLGKNACTSHKVEARDLYNLVLKDIQELAAMALKDVESFYQRISSRMERRYLADASEMEKERERLEARNRELDEGILNRLIGRILVGEVKKVDGEKFQEIKIIYNFVGEIPAVTE